MTDFNKWSALFVTLLAAATVPVTGPDAPFGKGAPEPAFIDEPPLPTFVPEQAQNVRTISEVVQADESTAPPVESDEPQLPERLSVRVDGPRDAIVGDLVQLRATTTGTPRQFAWSVIPPSAAKGLVPLDHGRAAVFSIREPGLYTVLVSAAGGGEVAHDAIEFSLLPAPPKSVDVDDLLTPPQPTDVGQLVREWVALVNSGNRDGEAIVIAGAMREVGNLAASGQLPDGSDPIRELERQAELAIGPPAFATWAPFFSHLRGFVQQLNVPGGVQTPADFSALLNNLADLVENAVGFAVE